MKCQTLPTRSRGGDPWNKSILHLLKDGNLLGLSFLSVLALFLAYQINLPYSIDIGLSDGAYVRRFHEREENELFSYRWSMDTSYLRLPIKCFRRGVVLKLTLRIQGWRPQGIPAPVVSVAIAGEPEVEFVADREMKSYELTFEKKEGLESDWLVVELRSDAFQPLTESRMLGIIVDSVQVNAMPISSGFIVPSFSYITLPTGFVLMGYILLRRWRISRRESFARAILLLVITSLFLNFYWPQIMGWTWLASFYIGLLLILYAIFSAYFLRDGLKPDVSKAQENDAIVLVSAFAAIALLLLSRVIDRSHHPWGDGITYVQMAKNPLDFTRAPYGYRVLTPFIAHYMPFQIETNFVLITFLTLFATMIGLFVFLRSLNHPIFICFTGVMLFLTSFGVTYSLYNPYLVDPLLYLLVVLAFYSLRTRKPRLFTTLVWIGTLDKESMLFLLPSYYFVSKEKDHLVDMPAFLKTIMISSIPVGTFIYLRTILFPAGSYVGYYGDLGVYMKAIRTKLNLAGLIEFYDTFGLVWLLAALNVRHEGFVRRCSSFLLAIFLQLFFATDIARVLFLSFPLMITAGLREFEQLSRAHKDRDRTRSLFWSLALLSACALSRPQFLEPFVPVSRRLIVALLAGGVGLSIVVYTRRRSETMVDQRRE